MKNLILMLIGTSILSLTSCDKLKDKLFQSFVTNSFEEKFNIDVITTTSLRMDVGTIQANLNIDSLIDAETDGAFDLDNVSSVKAEEVSLSIDNPDADNNFANFEEGWVNFSTNTNAVPVQIATGANPDAYSEVWMLPVDNSINLKDYLKGTILSYVIAAKARRVTTKQLNCTLSIKLKVE